MQSQVTGEVISKAWILSNLLYLNFFIKLLWNRILLFLEFWQLLNGFISLIKNLFLFVIWETVVILLTNFDAGTFQQAHLVYLWKFHAST